jgi:hypothetical protein
MTDWCAIFCGLIKKHWHEGKYTVKIAIISEKSYIWFVSIIT